MIKVTCNNCGKSFKARDSYAGRKASCPNCDAPITIAKDPPPPAPPPLLAARLPRVGLGLGIAGIALPAIDLAALITSGIALGNYDETQHDPNDRKFAIIGIALGLAGMLLKGCVLAGVIAWFTLNAADRQPPVPPAVTQAPPLAPIPEVAAPAPAPQVVPQVAPPVSTTVYYYDLGTDTLFAAKPASVTPIDAPSGKDLGVRAYVFACGDCSDPKQRFIAWLERTSAASRKALQNPNGMSIDDTIDSLMTQIEISQDSGKTWQGHHAIKYLQWQMQQRRTLCPNTVTFECRP